MSNHSLILGGYSKVYLAVSDTGYLSIYAPHKLLLSKHERVTMAKFLLEGTGHGVVQDGLKTPESGLPTLAQKLAEQEKKGQPDAQILRENLYSTPLHLRIALDYATAYCAALSEKFPQITWETGAVSPSLYRIHRYLASTLGKKAHCFIDSYGLVYQVYTFDKPVSKARFSITGSKPFDDVIKLADVQGKYLEESFFTF